MHDIVGDVVPIGASRHSLEGSLAMVQGDTYVDPLSNKVVALRSGYVHNNEVVPSSGHYQTLLDNEMIREEFRLLDAIQKHTDFISGETI